MIYKYLQLFFVANHTITIPTKAIFHKTCSVAGQFSDVREYSVSLLKVHQRESLNPQNMYTYIYILVSIPQSSVHW